MEKKKKLKRFEFNVRTVRKPGFEAYHNVYVYASGVRAAVKQVKELFPDMLEYGICEVL